MATHLRLALLLLAVGLGTSACAGGGSAGSAPGGGLPRLWNSDSATPMATIVPGAQAVSQGQANPAPYVSGTLRRYQVRGRWYEPHEQANYDEVGIASWYGPGFDGRPTATGERFDQYALTAAHKTLPLPALVEVTNLANGRQVILRVNDRGPFAEGRIIDLSRGAAEVLGLRSVGVGEVRVRYVGRAPVLGGAVVLQRDQSQSVPISSPTANSAMPSRASASAEQIGSYWVQAAALSDPVMAARLAERLGDGARVDRAEVRGRTVFRVRIGPWPDVNAAEQARQSVMTRGLPDALLMTAD